MEEAQSRYRKNVKALEGEKRAAVKKARGSKGKKAKEDLQALEEEYAVKLQEMEQRHREELAAIQKELDGTTAEVVDAVVVVVNENDEQAPNQENAEKEMRERKREKARRKHSQKLEQQKQLQREHERDLEGPSARKQELGLLLEQLEPLQLDIVFVASDGHCLYRAVAEQCDQTYLELRQLCATTLLEHEEDFSPFIEFTEEAPSFGRYVERIRHSADWGGHVELQVLSLALKRSIIVYSAHPPSPLSVPTDEKCIEEEEPIRLSYHLHYYSLGEHYNCVVPRVSDDNGDDDEQE